MHSSKSITTAWDNKEHKYVNVDDIDENSMHDKNRYFSDKFDITTDGTYIYTVRKEHTRRSNGKEYTVNRCFERVCENTKERRMELAIKMEIQKNLVYKLEEQLFSDGTFKFLRVPGLKYHFIGRDMPLFFDSVIILDDMPFNKMFIHNTIMHCVTAKTSILGVQQEILIKLAYDNFIDSDLRNKLIDNRENCIEIDISSLRDNLDMSESTLRKEMIKLIENGVNTGNTHWVSNRAHDILEKDVISKYIIERKLGDGFELSIHHSKDLPLRLYVFNDQAGFQPGNPVLNKHKSCSICDCNDCSQNLGILNYNSINAGDVVSICNKSALDLSNKSKLATFNNSVIEEMISML